MLRYPLFAFRPAFDHAQRRVGQRYRAILLDDADTGAHETTVEAALAAPRLDDLAFGMDRVAGEDRVFDIELHVQEGNPVCCIVDCTSNPSAKA